jgi:hypothetical protein
VVPYLHHVLHEAGGVQQHILPHLEHQLVVDLQTQSSSRVFAVLANRRSAMLLFRLLLHCQHKLSHSIPA